MNRKFGHAESSPPPCLSQVLHLCHSSTETCTHIFPIKITRVEPTAYTRITCRRERGSIISSLLRAVVLFLHRRRRLIGSYSLKSPRRQHRRHRRRRRSRPSSNLTEANLIISLTEKGDEDGGPTHTHELNSLTNKPPPPPSVPSPRRLYIPADKTRALLYYNKVPKSPVSPILRLQTNFNNVNSLRIHLPRAEPPSLEIRKRKR